MIHAVILAGGSGTRFWPLSRRDRPKQLLSLAADRTLLQGSWERAMRLVPPDRAHLVTAGSLAPAIAEQLPALLPEHLLVEPQPRDTAVAIGLAARLIHAEAPDAVLFVTPSDHVVAPEEDFAAAITDAAEVARSRGVIVTLGVRPRGPHTGYGYIRRGPRLAGWAGRTPAFEVAGFAEKPDRAAAERLVRGGEHLWNSGVFVFSTETILAELETHLPATRAAIERIAAAWHGPAREEVLRAEYARVERISIDYGVLERTRRLAVLEVDYGWSDVGSWSAVAELHGEVADADGNVARGGPFVGLDARRCFVQGDGRLVAVIGLEGIAVVQTRDATLVCPLDRAEEVKHLVKRLEEQGFDALV
jgi:mannose-1-phosphate guanylyltransferase